MKRSYRAVIAALLVVTPLLSSCAEVRDPISPPQQEIVQPQEGLIGGVLGGALGLIGNLLQLVGGILSGPDANGSQVYAWIGPQGGTLSTAAYTLVVPANAVSQNTKFVMKPTNTGTYSLELHAYRQGLLGLIDVSSNGFLKPVTLRVSYANAVGVGNPLGIVIVYVTPKGQVLPQSTIVNTVNQTVSTGLNHFSLYAMAE